MDKQFNRNMQNTAFASSAALGGALLAVASLPVKERKAVARNIIFFIVFLISLVPAVCALGLYNELNTIPKDEINLAYGVAVALTTPLLITTLILIKKIVRLFFK